MSIARKEFTTAEALMIQAEQLNKWKQLLKPKHYTALERWATRFNDHHSVKDGYDICRGSELDNFVSNLLNPANKPQQTFAYKHKLY